MAFFINKAKVWSFKPVSSFLEISLVELQASGLFEQSPGLWARAPVRSTSRRRERENSFWIRIISDFATKKKKEFIADALA